MGYQCEVNGEPVAIQLECLFPCFDESFTLTCFLCFQQRHFGNFLCLFLYYEEKSRYSRNVHLLNQKMFIVTS